MPEQEPAPGAEGRSYPASPIVGVGAVVVDAEHRVLLVRRSQPPLAGRWTLPGGRLELGEPLREGVAREVREETGLDVEVGVVVDAADYIERDTAGRVAWHYAIVDFLCRVRSGELTAGTDAADVAWVAEADLAAYGLAERARAVALRGLALTLDGVRADTSG